MAEVTTVRDSGIEILNDDIEGMNDDVDESTLARLPEPTDITVDESVEKEIQVRDVEYIGIASIDMTDTVAGMQAAMMGISPEDPAGDDRVESIDEETGEMEVRINEAAVFLASADGETGVGFVNLEDADVDDALAEFEERYL